MIFTLSESWFPMSRMVVSLLRNTGLNIPASVSKFENISKIFVRLNMDEHLAYEVEALEKFDIAGCMIPKFENLDILMKYEKFFERKK